MYTIGAFVISVVIVVSLIAMGVDLMLAIICLIGSGWLVNHILEELK